MSVNVPNPYCEPGFGGDDANNLYFLAAAAESARPLKLEARPRPIGHAAAPVPRPLHSVVRARVRGVGRRASALTARHSPPAAAPSPRRRAGVRFLFAGPAARAEGRHLAGRRHPQMAAGAGRRTHGRRG